MSAEFTLIERVERFRREQALRPLYVMVGSAEDGHCLNQAFLAALFLRPAQPQSKRPNLDRLHHKIMIRRRECLLPIS